MAKPKDSVVETVQAECFYRTFSKKEIRETTKKFVAKKSPKKWDREDLAGHVNAALEQESDDYLIRILMETGYITVD
jgi:hypothetical protein